MGVALHPLMLFNDVKLCEEMKKEKETYSIVITWNNNGIK